MNMEDIIIKKRDGGTLTSDEIKYFVKGYTAGDIPDYQASALLMAIYFQHLDKAETFQLTDAMRCSGDTIDLSGISGTKVDKHSTGGVGDKTTLIVGPLAAACGVTVAKMSGRGLGFTGGTVDKLDSIPGFSTSMEPAAFMAQVESIGIAVTGQTGHITPADKKIYALRDVTGTVENMSLIASSIMSKKLAAGSDAIVLDVKCGGGAFMKNLSDAQELSRIMCEIGESAGRKTVAVITDMSQPLGCAVGNALEVREAIDVLSGHGPADITELSLRLAGVMICLGGNLDAGTGSMATSGANAVPNAGAGLVDGTALARQAIDAGVALARQALDSGAGLAKLRELIAAQGGDPTVVDDPSKLTIAKVAVDVVADGAGYVCEIDAERIGIASQHTGAGRARKEDDIDYGAGVLLHKKVGYPVRPGEVLATVYSGNAHKAEAAAAEVKAAFRIGEGKPEMPILIKDIIS
ncbi:thymidine phosphorylase [Aminicella lysinilytica]|uniref:Pyrimidine-nucleoside phosphorylase n=1 Tax=Aminicella lysinilytica TaxID=433323 RepID=A0A4R6Q9J9_9FIRM|nr:thymidine phosphorylase [Aminicella lysinilytica]TDP58403.1 pyrimidine-nucleoside phosphorylase [Aminicella lysinilytica]